LMLMIVPTKLPIHLLILICLLLCLSLAAGAEEALETTDADDTAATGKTVVEAGSAGASGEAHTSGLGVTPFPVIYYTPETSLALGGGAVFTLRDGDERVESRPDNLQLMAAYTLENQFFLRLAPEKYFNEQRGRLFMNVAYLNWPTSFFGIGNGSGIGPDQIDDLEETYTDEYITVQPWLTHTVIGGLRAGVTLDWKNTRIADEKSGGVIDRGDLVGTRGGIQSGVGPVVEWDTRDNLFFPSEGSWYKVWAWIYREWMGSEFDYDCYALDFRHYRPVFEDGVLALQASMVLTSGEVPFYEYPTPPMRGLYENVFKDKNAAAIRAEYRFPINFFANGRWGGAVFGAVGDAFPDAATMEDFDPKVAGGAGLRFTLNKTEKINVRLDIGISRYGFFPYVMLNEAF